MIIIQHSKLVTRHSKFSMVAQDLAIGEWEFLIDEHKRIATANNTIRTTVKAAV